MSDRKIIHKIHWTMPQTYLKAVLFSSNLCFHLTDSFYIVFCQYLSRVYISKSEYDLSMRQALLLNLTCTCITHNFPHYNYVLPSHLVWNYWSASFSNAPTNTHNYHNPNLIYVRGEKQANKVYMVTKYDLWDNVMAPNMTKEQS